MKKYKRGICWGTWDGLHVGHLTLLENASKLCEKLYVGVSDDEYVIKHKGHKPMFTWLDRTSAIKKFAKDYVYTRFHQDRNFTKKVAVKYYNPDVIFVGDDWKGKDWDGAKLGVPVIYLPYTKNISSTKLRENAKFKH